MVILRYFKKYTDLGFRLLVIPKIIFEPIILISINRSNKMNQWFTKRTFGEK